MVFLWVIKAGINNTSMSIYLHAFVYRFKTRILLAAYLEVELLNHMV